MFNRSQIMKDAWAFYRDFRTRYGAWQIERGHVDASFSRCLKMAWSAAKNAAATVAHKLRVQRALAGPKAPQLQVLLNALQNVDFLPFRCRAADQRAAINTKIETLIQECA
ncbi:hypothetical protein OCK02_02095 [Rhizobium sp. TRM96647]|uniref:hypothetical protein n=1 Tax=unclassified Rhizobium TaxID=2613769 RepID=UPI0021E90F98|nr:MULTISPECIES: hypothetical protein [unclassified Rhizobium]MCV3734980.1 hypothetical protein [Rhizobium sp. TRM96647]MCV3757350.1 hypothetical protein [Rhizobium sp. TRM96650]